MTEIKAPLLTDDHFEPQLSPIPLVSIRNGQGLLIEAGWDQVGPDGVAHAVRQTETDRGWVQLFTPLGYSEGPYWPPRKAKGYRKHVRNSKKANAK